MYIKISLLLTAFLTSTTVLADLNKPFKVTKGDRLAVCMESTIPLMDRTLVTDIRSHTKYDKHYVSLNSTSIFVTYSGKNSLNIIFVNNEHIENATTAEAAKHRLQSIKSSLIQTSIGYCAKMLGLDENVKFSMLYIDPPYKSRALKRVINMDVSGKFTLP